MGDPGIPQYAPGQCHGSEYRKERFRGSDNGMKFYIHGDESIGLNRGDVIDNLSRGIDFYDAYRHRFSTCPKMWGGLNCGLTQLLQSC